VEDGRRKAWTLWICRLISFECCCLGREESSDEDQCLATNGRQRPCFSQTKCFFSSLSWTLFIRCIWNCKTPFTRYSRLSNRLYNWLWNRLYNRFDNRLYRVNKHPTGCQTGCQTGLTTGLTTVLNEQWLFVQPVVKQIWQPVSQQVVSCKRGFTYAEVGVGLWRHIITDSEFRSRLRSGLGVYLRVLLLSRAEVIEK